jgi:hypothetical protein
MSGPKTVLNMPAQVSTKLARQKPSYSVISATIYDELNLGISGLLSVAQRIVADEK